MNNEHRQASDAASPVNRHIEVPAHQSHAQAADVVRTQLETIYDRTPPNALTGEAKQDASVSAPYDQTYAATPYDWQHYHNAWQSYYQQYYQRYYLQQLSSHRQQQLMEKARTAAAQPVQVHGEQQLIVGTDPAATQQSKTALLRGALLSKISERADKVRRSHHFVPIVSALAVGLIFLFLQYNRVVFAEVQAYITPGTSAAEADSILVDPTTSVNVGAEPKLIIPKINVDATVDYSINTLQDGPIQAGLRDGVVHYSLPGADSLPGQVGNTVLLGHSSNDIFDPGNSKFVFVLLDHMEVGDVFYVHYQGTRYIYKVTDKKVIKPTEVSALQINNGKPLVTLVTCTPLGTDLRRLLVTGEQISPDPGSAKQPATSTASAQSVTLPGSSPTFLDRIYSFFFR